MWILHHIPRPSDRRFVAARFFSAQIAAQSAQRAPETKSVDIRLPDRRPNALASHISSYGAIYLTGENASGVEIGI